MKGDNINLSCTCKSDFYKDSECHVHGFKNIQPITRKGIKCDICGSTAIDHTENQCSINRQLTKIAGEKE